MKVTDEMVRRAEGAILPWVSPRKAREIVATAALEAALADVPESLGSALMVNEVAMKKLAELERAYEDAAGKLAVLRLLLAEYPHGPLADEIRKHVGVE